MGKKTISIRVDPELWQKARVYAVKNKIRISDFVEQAIKKQLG